jgi:hypothetical protein
MSIVGRITLVSIDSSANGTGAKSAQSRLTDRGKGCVVEVYVQAL